MKRLFVPAALLLLAQPTSADNWPAWRGPQGNGHCKEKDLPVKWSATENVRWKVALPSDGMSTPVIWGDRIFLTQATNSGQKRAVMCFDRKAGKLLWQQVVEYQENEAGGYEKEDHPYCRASPVTDGERVIVSHGSAGVFCYDWQGKELWHRELGKFVHFYGNASSPVLYGDLVILNCGPGETTFLVALDKKTGKEVWRADEPSKYRPGRYTGSFVTPVVATIKGRDELIMSWPGVVKAYDPRTGKLLWSCEGLGTMIQNNSPLVTADIIIAMSYGNSRDLAIKTGGNGDVTETHRLWHKASTSRTGAGVVVGDSIYATMAPTGMVECMELKTGKTVWNERLRAGFWSSMVHADGRLYVTDVQGTTFVLAAKPKFEVVSRNPLEERTVASPAISNGEIFIRTYKHLWCISNK